MYVYIHWHIYTYYDNLFMYRSRLFFKFLFWYCSTLWMFFRCFYTTRIFFFCNRYFYYYSLFLFYKDIIFIYLFAIAITLFSARFLAGDATSANRSFFPSPLPTRFTRYIRNSIVCIVSKNIPTYAIPTNVTTTPATM